MPDVNVKVIDEMDALRGGIARRARSHRLGHAGPDAARRLGCLMLGYPRLAERRVLGTVRVRPVTERTRRAVLKQLVLGVLLIVPGLLFDSIGLVALALSFWIFWFGLIWSVRRRGGGAP